MKQYISVLLVMALLLGLAGCGAAPGAAETTGERAFFDDCGREVRLSDEITRVIPSGPMAQMMLFAIAPDMLVGVADKLPESARGILPEGYYDLPYTGQLYRAGDLNVEELAALGPQVMIDIGEPKGSVAADLDRLQSQTGIPAVFLSATLETVPDAFRALGALLGREEKGEELALFCEKIYSRTMDIMEQVGDHKVNALYVLGEEGLNVLAKGSYHAEMMDLITDNAAVVSDPVSKGTGNAVSIEQIALWNPDVILFDGGSIYDAAAEKAVWNQLDAITSGRYLEIPSVPNNWMGSPPSVQRYLGLIWLPAVLYPEFCDYDVKADILEYYRLFYGCALTDAQYDAITAHAFWG